MMLWNNPNEKKDENKEKTPQNQEKVLSENEEYLIKELFNLKHEVEINFKILEQRLDNVCRRLDREERRF